MMPSEFPLPFSGCRFTWVCESLEELAAGARRLATCHPHNFAVDGTRLAIHGSEMAMECLREEMVLQKFKGDRYDQIEHLLFVHLADWFTEHTKTRRRDMPANISTDLRRMLQQRALVIAADDRTDDDAEMERWEPDIIEKPVSRGR